MVCLSPGEAQRALQNKADIGRWMRGSNALMNYYENSGKSFDPGASQ